MRRTVKCIFFSAAVLMFLVPLSAQTDSIAVNWTKTFSVTKHSTSTVDTVLVTDEVSAGWDFDGDGNLEFLVMTDNSNPNGGGAEFPWGTSLFLYEGSASGYEIVWSWMDTSLFTGGASFPTMDVGDLDGDGNLELLLGIPYGTGNPPDGSNPDRFLVFEADASGLPATPTAVWNFGASVGSNTRPSAMATGDVDGDGRNEVLVGFRAFSDAVTNDAVIIFSLNGSFAGSFTQWTIEVIDTTSSYNSTYSATTSDVDGDGMLEFFIPSFSNDRGHFWEGTGTADTYAHTVVSNSPHWLGGLHSARAWDVDGDEADELFVGVGQKTIVMINGVSDVSLLDTSVVDTNSTFVDTIITGLTASVRGLAVGDFDGNGLTDVFVGGNYNQNVHRWEYDGVGVIGASASWIDLGVVYQQHAFVDDTLRASGPSRVYSVAFGGAAKNGAGGADLDGNSYPDLVIGYEDGDSTFTSYVVVVEQTGSVAIEYRPGAQVLNSYRLSDNYPNPFNPSTSLAYSLTMAGRVEIVIYDILGQHVKTLVSRDANPGEYSVDWDGTNALNQMAPSGVYIARMSINGASLTTRMTLLK